jgi:hypothetical protein
MSCAPTPARGPSTAPRGAHGHVAGAARATSQHGQSSLPVNTAVACIPEPRWVASNSVAALLKTLTSSLQPFVKACQKWARERLLGVFKAVGWDVRRNRSHSSRPPTTEELSAFLQAALSTLQGGKDGPAPSLEPLSTKRFRYNTLGSPYDLPYGMHFAQGPHAYITAAQGPYAD